MSYSYVDYVKSIIKNNLNNVILNFFHPYSFLIYLKILFNDYTKENIIIINSLYNKIRYYYHYISKIIFKFNKQKLNNANIYLNLID